MPRVNSEIQSALNMDISILDAIDLETFNHRLLGYAAIFSEDSPEYMTIMNKVQQVQERMLHFRNDLMITSSTVDANFYSDLTTAGFDYAEAPKPKKSKKPKKEDRVDYELIQLLTKERDQYRAEARLARLIIDSEIKKSSAQISEYARAREYSEYMESDT